MHRQNRTDSDIGKTLLGNIDLELYRTIGKHGQHRRGRACNIARIAHNIGDPAGSGCLDRSLRALPFCCLQLCFRTFYSVFRRLYLFGPGWQFANGQIGCALANGGFGHFKLCRGIVELCLRRHSTPGKIARAQ